MNCAMISNPNELTTKVLISEVKARQIFDSRGNPTVEVDVHLSNGHSGRASVPSGASTGRYEAVEKRDQDPKLYCGKSVFDTISLINGEIDKKIVGLSPFDQAGLDKTLIHLDGTENKSRLGANGILAVSLAVARASANARDLPLYVYLAELFQTQTLHSSAASNVHVEDTKTNTQLPMPMMNFVNGGAHSDAPIDIQEFMLIPTGAQSFSEALKMGMEVFHELKKRLTQKGLSTSVGDEGGFAPHLRSSESVLDELSAAVKEAGYILGSEFCFALDAAATEFFDAHNKVYDLKGAGLRLSSEDLVTYYEKLVRTYPIVSIEDGMAEDDFAGWALLTSQLGKSVQIVGDDLFVTNPKRLQIGFEQNLATSILIKPNQIGTLSETFETIHMAQKNGYTCVISHRSGETEDTFIADLSVATRAGQIKTGSLSRTDRVAKYNQLLRIEEKLSNHAQFSNPFSEKRN